MRIHNHKLGNQILSLLMALVMVVSMMPMSSFTAFAADESETSVTDTATIDLSQYADGATVNITEDSQIIGDGTEYNVTLNIAADATVIFEVGTSGVKLGGSINVADGKTLTLLVEGNAEHTVKGGISLGNSANVIIEGDLDKVNNKLTVTASGGNAGIGANGSVTAGDITIRNARVDATGSTSDSSQYYMSGAGIGTANASMGNILIENSIVTAAGGYYFSSSSSDPTSHAAAIGMGSSCVTMGNITLIDSEITASNNGDGHASVIGAGSFYHPTATNDNIETVGNMGNIIITSTELNLSMAKGPNWFYAAMIGPGLGNSAYSCVNMGKIIFTDVTQAELDEMIATWSIPSDFNQYGAYVLGRGRDGSYYDTGDFGGVWVSDGNGGTVQIGDKSGYYEECTNTFLHTYDNLCDVECNVCGITRLLVHTEGTAATCTAQAVCAVCGVSYGDKDAEAHSGGEATCTTLAICSGCGVSYGDVAHSFDETTGFCNVCGGYQPAVLNEDGVYEISNAGQLYWFAAVVNGGYGDVAQNTSANAVLTENITVNENVLKADGTLNGDGSTFRVWTPIGNSTNKYTGTFDGNNKTVSGLYFNDSDTKYVGLFGHVGNGTVKNVGVIDSYLRGYLYVGGVVGRNYIGTVRNCYNSGTVSGSENVGGVVGYLECGTVQSCYNTGTVNGSYYVGGVVGYYYGRLGDDPYGTVTNCYNTGAVSGNRQVGGVVGNMYEGTVQSCYNTGTVSCSSYVGGVVGYMYKGTVQSCYYLSGTAAGGINGSDVTGSAEAKTAAQFASGEVAYLLNGDQSTIVFMQTLGTDDYPNFTGAKVYSGYDSCAETATAIYTNDSTVPAEKLAHSGGEATCQKQAVCVLCGTSYGDLNPANHEYENGVCPCGAIAPIEKNANGIYEIYVPEQLVEFAQIVNGTHATIPQDKAANAILKADIDMTGIDWTPICSTGLYYNNSYASGYGDADTGYAGTFDGNYHVIKNLSVTAIANETWTYGLFGTMTGTVKNLGIEGFTYNHNSAKDMRTGAIVGQNLGGTIENCYVVKATITPGTNVAGGITGCNYEGTIKNCYVANSTVLASASRYGYIAGDNRADTAGDRVGTIENCYTDGDRLVGSYTGTETNSKYGVNYNYFTNGGVVWYLNGQSADGIWKQGETHPNFTGTAVTQSLLSTYTQPEIKDGVYQIKTESELRWFAEYVNFTDASVSAVLANDIAMTGDNWIPIGMYGTPFTGTFNGQGYGITGFAMTITEGGRFGLFGEISGATVKNFSIDGEVTANLPSQQTFYYGVIGASANSTITDIHSSVGLKVKDSFDKNGIAGIVASITTTTIERCSFSGTLDIGTAYIDCAGGIVGYAGWNNTHVIRDCAFYGKIVAKHESSDKTSSGQIGGILGYYRGSNITIESCLSVGTFDVANTTFTGMIGGRVLQMGADNISKVSNNYYYGNLPAFSDTEDSTHGYWNADMADYEGYGDTNAKSVTDTQLKSGEVTWLLNDGVADGTQVWYQTIGAHDVPGFEGATVNLNGTTYENTGNYIYVEITWTGMSFTYVSGDWNPETHQYDEGYWKGDVVNNGEVTVTNKGSAVYVSFGYTSSVEGVDGSFDPANTSICLEKGESVGASLNLTGEPTGGPFTDRQIGTVTVTISQTPPAAMTATWKAGDTVDYIGKNGKAYSCYIVSDSDGKYVLLTKEPEILAGELEALRKTQLEEVGAARYPTYRIDDDAEYVTYESYLYEQLPRNVYGNSGGYFSPMVNDDGHDRWARKSASTGTIFWGSGVNSDAQGYFYYIFEVPVS